MKNIKFFHANKYDTDEYFMVEKYIYKTDAVKNEESEMCLSLMELTDEEELKAVRSITNWKKGEIEDVNDDMLTGIYNGKKYYKEIDDDEIIYINMEETEEIYVTSIMFEPEPELDENEPTDPIVSQYPLEDILEKFLCYVSDDYKMENKNDKVKSYVEFASEDINDIRNLLSILGKHVYNKEEGEYVKLIIE